MGKAVRTTKASARRTNLFVDPELWRALRMRALEEGTTATDLLNQAIRDFLEKPRLRSTEEKGA